MPRDQTWRGDELPRPTRADVARLGGFLVVMSVAGCYFIYLGLGDLERSGELKVLAGAVLLLSVVGILVGVVRESIRRRNR